MEAIRIGQMAPSVASRMVRIEGGVGIDHAECAPERFDPSPAIKR
jgi:hypothetical protein